VLENDANQSPPEMPNGEFEVGPSRSHTSRLPRSQHQDIRPSTEADGDDLSGPRGRSPQLLPVSDAAAAYRLVYGRVDALIRGRAEVAELTVPACPAWTIRQTVAHLTWLAQDIVSLNLEEKGTDSWTRVQVDRLGDHSIDELLDLWRQMIDPVTATLALAPQASACQLVFDTLTHEHDIRGALREPGPRTGDLAFEAAMGFATTMADHFIRHAGLPSLRLITPTTGSVQLGDPHTARGQVALNISDFEALRTFGGRRSIRQLLALPWHGDPTHLLPAFTHQLPAFTNDGIRPPNDDLLE
jgi:uncharacterized protein (TIGR03083 family)